MRGALLVAALLVLGGCAASPDGPPADPPPASSASPVPSTSVPTTPTTTPSAAAPATPEPVAPVVRRVRGIDVSHHQGDIDWERVAGDGITFAYLKATEGSGYGDPRFADHWNAASRAGLRVGGYHYFTLCSDPLPQATHFATTLAAAPDPPGVRPLPPVVDLELIGNCDPSPVPATMEAAVRAFLAEVERRMGRSVVVYTHPDFDARYGFVDDLDRRRWVRRPGDTPPTGDWWMWQRSDDARVDGIDGPVDLDVMQTRVDNRPSSGGG